MAFSYTAGKPEEREDAEFFVPAGKYNLRVTSAKAETSGGGNDMIKLQLRVINKDDGQLGVSLFDYLVFTPKAFFKIDQFLMSAGKHPGEGQVFDFENKIDDLIGWEVEADLKVETYDGKKNNKVAAYLFDEFD